MAIDLGYGQASGALVESYLGVLRFGIPQSPELEYKVLRVFLWKGSLRVRSNGRCSPNVSAITHLALSQGFLWPTTYSVGPNPGLGPEHSDFDAKRGLLNKSEAHTVEK